MKKKKRIRNKIRLPMEAIESIGRGKFHTTKKGKKGYNRKREKAVVA